MLKWGMISMIDKNKLSYDLLLVIEEAYINAFQVVCLSLGIEARLTEDQKNAESASNVQAVYNVEDSWDEAYKELKLLKQAFEDSGFTVIREHAETRWA
jgi:hypothetical protein